MCVCVSGDLEKLHYIAGNGWHPTFIAQAFAVELDDIDDADDEQLDELDEKREALDMFLAGAIKSKRKKN